MLFMPRDKLNDAGKKLCQQAEIDKDGSPEITLSIAGSPVT